MTAEFRQKIEELRSLGIEELNGIDINEFIAELEHNARVNQEGRDKMDAYKARRPRHTN